MQLIRDPAWQFVGAVVAVLALLLSFVVAAVQRRRKKIAYQILTATPLFTVQEEVKGRIQIRLDGETVEDPSLIVIRVTSRGNLPIRPMDFERPLSFTFGDGSRVIGAEVTRQRPHNLNASVTFTDERLTVTPLLLNGGDWFEVKCLASHVVRVEDDARIEGVSQIKRELTEPLFPLFAGLIGLILLLGGIIAFPHLAPEPHQPPPRPATPVAIVLNVITLAGLILISAPWFPILKRVLTEIRQGSGKLEQ